MALPCMKGAVEVERTVGQRTAHRRYQPAFWAEFCLIPAAEGAGGWTIKTQLDGGSSEVWVTFSAQENKYLRKKGSFLLP